MPAPNVSGLENNNVQKYANSLVKAPKIRKSVPLWSRPSGGSLAIFVSPHQIWVGNGDAFSIRVGIDWAQKYLNKNPLRRP